jgi:hypothetical protein
LRYKKPKDCVMRNLSLSQIYAIGTVLLLTVAILVNQPLVTLIISALGLVAGALVLRRGEVRRVAMVAMAGFGAAAVMSALGLFR